MSYKCINLLGGNERNYFFSPKLSHGWIRVIHWLKQRLMIACAPRSSLYCWSFISGLLTRRSIWWGTMQTEAHKWGRGQRYRHERDWHKLLCAALLKENDSRSAQFWQVPQLSLSSILMKENKQEMVQPEHQGVAGTQTLPIAVLSKGLPQRRMWQKSVNRLRPMVCNKMNYF